MSEPLLRLDGISAGYDRATVLEDITFALPEGGSLAVLGRNGVGKSTLIRTILGLTTRHAGRILYRGRDITGLAAAGRAALGIGWVPQERGIFRSLTLRENLEVAARPGFWTLARVFDLVPHLRERQDNRGWQLSGGEQQLLAIGRALMLNPSLLLLDEPLEGLAPVMADRVLDTLKELVRISTLSIIMVEQHAADVLAMTATALVMDRGTIVERGRSADLLADPARLAALTGVVPPPSPCHDGRA